MMCKIELATSSEFRAGIIVRKEGSISAFSKISVLTTPGLTFYK